MSRFRVADRFGLLCVLALLAGLVVACGGAAPAADVAPDVAATQPADGDPTTAPPTAELAATEAPMATDEPPPTEEPMPTEEPSATEAPPTPEPSATPAGAAVSAGLGVPRVVITDLFAQPGIDFVFEEEAEVNGAPRVVAVSPSEMATIELIGPEDNLLQATLSIELPQDNLSLLSENVTYATVFIETFYPEWADAVNWLAEGLESVSATGESVTSQQDGSAVAIEPVGDSGAVIISVTADGYE